jgi:two-component system, sensor histidine kinase and response regulator
MPEMDGFMFATRVRRDRQLRSTPLVMLTSAAHPDDPARCRKLGIEGHLTKPVKQSDLLDTILSLFGGRAQRGADAVETLDRTPLRALRVLVAEDNQVNRQFVTRVLEKRGHAVTTTENGRQAIDAIAAGAPGHFDLVLMDVQMPEVDGLSATVLIRQRERSSGGHIPIVAMTAHAMSGDRERCLSAGMDDYVSKPLHPHELVAAVERAVEARQTAPAASPPATAAAPAAAPPIVFDMDSACRRLGGDRQLLREVIVIFRAESRTLLAKIKDAASRDDGEALRRAAHSLKGSLGTLHAPRAFAVAARLEEMARKDEKAPIPEAVAELDREMKALSRALEPVRPRAVKRKVARDASRPTRRRPRARRR